jgi:hypothetical protein
MIQTRMMIMVLGLYGILIFGCMSEIKYQDYEDKESKGEQVFFEDLKLCRQFANQNMKPSEGSEAAGERLMRKRSLFQLCMKKHYWALKQ